MSIQPRVLIYRSDWLAPSEGFVSDHAGSLSRYEPITLGLRRPAMAGDFAAPTAWACGTPTPQPLARYGFRALGIGTLLDGLIERTRPALLHAHFATDALDLLPFARRHRLPLLVTLHGYDLRSPHDPQRRFKGDSVNWRLKHARLFREASRFLPVSNALHREALTAGFPAAKLQTHYLGAALGTTLPLPLAARSGIAYVGRLIDRKGLGDLLQALARLKLDGLAPSLEIVGDGPQRGLFEQQARDLGLAARFHGALPRQAAQNLMGRARLFCMPARDEPFGLVFIEAQNRGTPVVAYADAGALEAVADGQTGLLAPTGDIAALADHIGTLLADDALWKRFSTNALEHVAAHFDIRAHSRQLEQIYDEVVSDGPRRGPP